MQKVLSYIYLKYMKVSISMHSKSFIEHIFGTQCYLKCKLENRSFHLKSVPFHPNLIRNGDWEDNLTCYKKYLAESLTKRSLKIMTKNIDNAKTACFLKMC